MDTICCTLCEPFMQIKDTIFACFNGSEDIPVLGRRSSEAKRLKKAYETPLKIRRSEEVGHNLFPPGYRADDESDSEEETSVYEKKTPSPSAAQAQKKRAVLNNQVERGLKGPGVAKVDPRPGQSRETAQKPIRPGVAKVDPRPGQSRETAQKASRPGVAKVDPRPGQSRETAQKASRPGVAKVDPRPGQSRETAQKASRPGVAKVDPRPGQSRKTAQKASRPGVAKVDPKPGQSRETAQKASQPGAAKVDPKPRPSRDSPQKGGRLGAARPGPSKTPIKKVSQPGAAKGPRPGPSKQNVLEASRPETLKLEPQSNTSKHDVEEASRPRPAELDAQPVAADAQPGTSKQNFYEASRPRTGKLYPPANLKKQTYAIQTEGWPQVKRAVLTYSLSDSDSEKKRKKRQKITPKDCPARYVFELLAAATVVASGERHSFTPLEDLRDRYINVLYENFLEERNALLVDPPSPAPHDPQIDAIRQVYVDRFEGFVPTLHWLNAFQDPRIIDYILERDKPESIRSLLHKKFPPRRTSLPNTVGYRYKHSSLSDNLLPDEYGQPMRIKQIIEKKGKKKNKHNGVGIIRSRSLPRDYEDYFRSIYGETHQREHIYDRTHWSPEPCEEESIFDEEKIIREYVKKYRKRSARTYLHPSPEVPDDLKRLQALFKVAKQVFTSPVRQWPLGSCLKRDRSEGAEPRVYYRPRLSESPLRQPEDSSNLEYRTAHTPRYRPSRERRRRKMGRMSALSENDRKIIIEFCHLLEKSKQLFNGLREMPQYGHKPWHSYFGKTFDVYTKLWKFQQQHRAILDNKYGLKRWQIGEIASKIGQLYYHFYLRTSDTAYLNEAFSFYYAIRGRSYYTQACKEDKCELMVKKLRYYARFIVASLLLKKVNLVSELLKELDKQIIEYGNAYEPDDQNEWRIVADEVRTFIEVETVVEVIHPREYSCQLSHRLGPPIGPHNASGLDRASPVTLTLREALIIGSNSTQLKFSELTMDMYRIMQTLEREPNADINHLYDHDESPRQRNPPTPSAFNHKGYNLDGTYNTGEAPHKQMLFKPSPNQIFLYLSSAIDDLPPNGVVLLYISAEGLIVPNSKHPEEAGGYDIGGLITTSKTDVLQRETSSSKDVKGLAPKLKEAPVLHPGDLYPFTRRPLFVIVDSDNSFIFSTLSRFFGQPLIILMSPIELPTTLYPGTDDQRMEGSLFTLFLHDPMSAVCLCCDIKRIPLDVWEQARNIVDSYLKEAGILLSRIRECTYVMFLNDDFLRLLILRFIFCETVLRMHRLFRGRAQRTRCSPALPDDLYEHPVLTRIVMELATKLQVRGHFHDPAAVQRE